MPSWKDTIGRARSYSDDFPGRNDVVLWEVVEIEKEQLIKITFLRKNSPDRQGIRLAIDAGDGYLEINAVRAKEMELWEDTAPREVICKCVSSEGLLSLYNIWWEEGETGSSSQMYGSGMVVDEKDGKLTYHCNDWGVETNFDKLVFALEKV